MFIQCRPLAIFCWPATGKQLYSGDAKRCTRPLFVSFYQLYEDALTENEKLKSRLQDSKQELTKIRSQLDRVTQVRKQSQQKRREIFCGLNHPYDPHPPRGETCVRNNSTNLLSENKQAPKGLAFSVAHSICKELQSVYIYLDTGPAVIGY